jgi:hypothetical protein
MMANKLAQLPFALSMSVSLGIKSLLDYSVWVGSAVAFLLAVSKNNLVIS